MNVTSSTPATEGSQTQRQIDAPLSRYTLSHFSHDPKSPGRQTLLRDGVPFAYLNLIYATCCQRPCEGCLPGVNIGVLLDPSIPCLEATVAHRDLSGVLEALLVKAGVDVAEVTWIATKLLLAPKVEVPQ